MTIWLPGKLIWDPMLKIIVPKIYKCLSYVVPSVWHLPKCESLSRKAGVQYKPHCLYIGFDIPSNSVNGRSIPPIQVHILANGWNFKQDFLRIAVSGLLLILYYTEPKCIKLFRFSCGIKTFFSLGVLMCFSSWIYTLIESS